MNKRWLAVGSCLTMSGLIAASGSQSHADIKYTSETRMGAMQNAGETPAKPMLTTTTYVMQGAQRTETAQSFGPVHMNSVELKLCAKQETIKLDPALKIYTVTPFAQKAANTATAANAAPDAPAENTPRGAGKIINTSSVKDLGEEMVADVKTEHYLITSHIQTSGCAGNTDMNLKMETWVGPSLTTEMHCDVERPDPAQMMGHYRSNCKLTFEQHGDMAAYGKIMSGIIMRMKMYMGDADKPTMIQEVTGLSNAKLDTSLFELPADYKQVTDKEFQDAQSHAMMAAMMDRVKQGGAGNDNSTPDNNGGTANQGGNQTTGDQGNNGQTNTGQTNNSQGNTDQNTDQQPAAKPKKRPRLPFKLPF